MKITFMDDNIDDKIDNKIKEMCLVKLRRNYYV